MAGVDKKMIQAFDAVSGVWETYEQIFGKYSEKYRERRTKEVPFKYFFVLLLRLKDKGLVESRKRVVYGKNGGAVVYSFRRAVGATLEGA